MNHPYLPVMIFLAVALAVPISLLVLARLWMRFFTPIKRGAEKNALYECLAFASVPRVLFVAFPAAL